MFKFRCVFGMYATYNTFWVLLKTNKSSGTCTIICKIVLCQKTKCKSHSKKSYYPKHQTYYNNQNIPKSSVKIAKYPKCNIIPKHYQVST
jgi:hypothetical protein